jgi:hypothetical protein
MIKKPSEIAAERVTLEVMKPNVLRRNMFGEDHHEAIDAQIAVLTNVMDMDAIEAAWGDDTADEYADHVHMAAISAHDWMMGLSTEPAPSVDWQELVRP